MLFIEVILCVKIRYSDAALEFFLPHIWWSTTLGAKIPQRWVFGLMGCLGLANAYTMRICLSLAITEMVLPTSSSNGTSSDGTCLASDSTSSSSSGGTYDWDEYTKGIILSSFFWGYIITQIPGGLVADKFGGKHTLGIGILSTAIFTIVTPVVVETFGATGLVVLRCLMGLGEGTTFPALNVLIAQWAPPHERSKIATVAMAGCQIGTIVGNLLTGVMIKNSSMGWPVVFYFYGGVSIVWFVAWCILCYSHPEDHPFITEKEKKYLHETMKEHTHRVAKLPPWRDMLMSVPLWALLAAKFGIDCGYHTMVTDLPLYMSNVLKFPVQSNGFYTALFYVFMWLASVSSSWLADWVVKTDRMSRTNTRKACTTVATVIPAIFLVTGSYAGCDKILTVILFTVGMGFMGFMYPGMMVNGLDLSPNYSGTLMAIMSTVGALAGIGGPYMVGILTTNQSVSEWRVVFWITFAIFLVAAVIFVFWADGEVQYWNNPDARIPNKKESLVSNGYTLENPRQLKEVHVT